MSYRNLLITALRALSKNKMRSVLTSIGIIIGISSVIVMIGLGNSAKVEVRDKIVTFGANAISFSVNSGITGKWIYESDLVELKKNYYQIDKISPFDRKSSLFAIYKDKNTQTNVEGVGEAYFDIKGNKIDRGRFLSENDIVTTAKVAVIGVTVENILFSGRDPIGEVILINGVPFTVVGIMERQGKAFGGRDFDNVVMIPYTTFNKRIRGRAFFDEIYVKAKEPEYVLQVEKLLVRYFRNKFLIPEGQPDRFEISTSEDKLKMANDISNALAILLAGIASISLFVGGVGIMNIMLVSVTERTREIGIRMAIGAKKKDIMMQFLIESVSLSMFGGLVGIALGIAIYALIVYFVKWPFIFTITSILVSVLFATAVGVFFGYYPSKKAAELKPIEALKYE
jgi:putative ABC transport system permease protein